MVLAPIRLRWALSLAKAISIGFRSGLYGGRKRNQAPRSLRMVLAFSLLCAARLSRMTTSPACSVRGQLRGDVEVEHLAVHRTIDDPGGGQAIAPQCGDERLRFPVTARRPRLEPLVAPGPAAQACQFGRRGRFIDEDEAVRLAAHARLAAAAPHPAVLADVIAPALRGHQCFF